MVVSREIFNRIDRHHNVDPSCIVVPLEIDSAIDRLPSLQQFRTFQFVVPERGV
jgi:hypothetical protein